MRVPLLCLLVTLAVAPVRSQSFSQSQSVDFFRDVKSRHLTGLATRSDGRIVTGPRIQPLVGDVPADLIWTMVPDGPDRWLVGTGPDGKIFEINFAWDSGSFSTREVATVTDAQVFALVSLPGARVIAGTSPRGILHLIVEGKVQAALRLPADSVLDLLALPDGDLLVATGNPGRIYRVAPDQFAASGIATEAPATPAALAAAGITEFGRIRDRNVRRLFCDTDGTILAGSAPGGRVYAFPAAGGDPVIRFEQERAEVTDILRGPDGDLYLTVVIDAKTGGARIIRPTPAKAEDGEKTEDENEPPPPSPDFPGRSQLVRLPAGGGLPDTVASRNNIAFYRVALHGSLLLLSGGDGGELAAYDPANRQILTLPATDSAQNSSLVPLGADRFLIAGNNPATFSLVDFSAGGARSAETHRIDLRTPGRLGAVKFNRMRGLTPDELKLELRANLADDEREGWTAWAPLTYADGGFIPAASLLGRFVQLRLTLPPGPSVDPVELDRAELFFLPENRRPQLSAFRILSPNYALLARTESPSGAVTTLGQVIGQSRRGGEDSEERRNSAALLSSQVVPAPFTQIIHWTVEDADNDNLAATLSIRRDQNDTWHDLVIGTTAGFAQFDRRQFPDGHYFSRLTVHEQAPRTAADQHTVVFETDDLLIDNTPPEIEDVTVTPGTPTWRIAVRGRDSLSGLTGMELTFNQGHTVRVEQPEDGVLDQRAETFVTDIPAGRLLEATAVEITLYDESGNYATRRLMLPLQP